MDDPEIQNEKLENLGMEIWATFYFIDLWRQADDDHISTRQSLDVIILLCQHDSKFYEEKTFGLAIF